MKIAFTSSSSSGRAGMLLLLLVEMFGSVHSWSLPGPWTQATLPTTLSDAWTPPLYCSRRDAWQHGFLVSLAVVSSTTLAVPSRVQALNEDDGDDATPRLVNRMGGLLVPYQDGPRGFRILAPSGWNKFEGEVGAYDVKWQDLVDPTENVKISSTPVPSATTSVQALGAVNELGIALAKKRQAQLMAATQRQTDGIWYYQFEFMIPDGTHQLLQFCIGKGKLWSLDANAKESRWSRRKELYENILGSFEPKLS